MTSLHSTARTGDLIAIQQILSAPCAISIDVFGDEPVTPLFHAVAGEKSDAIRLLLAKGANINIQLPPDLDSQSLLHYAVVRVSDLEIIRIIIDNAPAQVSALAINQATPLHYAVQYKRPSDLINLLLRAGANPLARIDSGQTTIELALAWGNRSAAEQIRNFQKRGALFAKD